MIEGREERDPGYDDWFDEPEPLTETQNAARGAYDADDEVWVVPEDERRRPRGRRGEIVIAGRTLTTTQAAVLGASVIALVLAILAAAGVFSGSKAALPPVTTTPPATTATHTGTTIVTPPAVQAPSQTLKPGDTGAQVKILQRALASLGYSPGKPDGDYGPSTQAAVEAFQSAKGLTADGILGPETLAKLQSELSG
jgi:putative peptidoglycan binding protein